MQCVVLAGGLSSRMGRNKLLVEVGGRTVIERCIDAFGGICGRIIVVTGRYRDDIERLLAPYPHVLCVYNPDYMSGMFSSVKAGVRQVDAERFFIVPGDYPCLKPSTTARMARVPGRFIVPLFEGMPGHPVLLDRAFLPIIMDSRAQSLRECLKDASAWRVNVPVDDSGVLRDVDTFSDLQELPCP